MKRRLRVAGLLLLAVITAYGVLHVFPQPLFPYALRQGTVVLHARAPFPTGTTALLVEVERRLAKSPLFDATQTHHVFLCDTPGLYAFFVPHHPRTGAETFFWLGNQIFLRPSRLEADRLIGPSGVEVTGNRTLTYFLAHELTHAMTADAVGVWRYVKLQRWQQDGYADYVAKAGDFDVEGAVRGLRSDAAELDPDRSGLYLRYHLLVSELLDHRGVSVADLLSGPRDAAPIEAALRRTAQ